MRAASGAIERVRINNDSVQYQTIDGVPPIGICGSGILDAIAQLYLAGVIGENGRIKNNHRHIRTFKQNQYEFILADESTANATTRGPDIPL